MFTDIGKVMMAFILATDFDFIAYMSKMAFFWKLFSRQWRFWNMISMIFVVLYNIQVNKTIAAFHIHREKKSAPSEDRTHDLQIALRLIMRLTRYVLRYRGM